MLIRVRIRFGFHRVSRSHKHSRVRRIRTRDGKTNGGFLFFCFFMLKIILRARANRPRRRRCGYEMTLFDVQRFRFTDKIKCIRLDCI